ncbi:hypothetical protein E2C01_026064 [Portunus trituberculatus]|uniref:Mutator-like transposase domain-containing protein n=1 Tax=Portunus trituberculatus TaxID=210409 RepID=A0A5B7EH49_PORTR|nr:hypothetical protein [Portunus trituberculatus]
MKKAREKRKKEERRISEGGQPSAGPASGTPASPPTTPTVAARANLPTSSAKKRKRILSASPASSYTFHEENMIVNYTSTSGGMEAAEALACWNRSLSHNMRYINFISDGDSSAYSCVKLCNEGEGPYGKDHLVEKMDCINHVAKRLGTGLRKETQTVKTKSGKTVKRSVIGGQNKLTDKVITRLQFSFRRGITRKVNMTEEEMRNDIMSSLEHCCSSSDTNPKHHLCPKSSDSWCFYQKALALGETPPSHSTTKVPFVLEPDQLQLVRKITGKYFENLDKKMDVPLKKKMRDKQLQKDLHYTPGGH